MVSSQCLHEKSFRFCKVGNGRAFFVLYDPYFRFITKGQKPLHALLIFSKMSCMATTTKNTNTKFIAGVWKNAIPVVSPFLPRLSRHLPEAGFCCLRGDSAVMLVYIRQQRSCSDAGSSEHLASASVLQKRRKSGKNLRK